MAFGNWLNELGVAKFPDKQSHSPEAQKEPRQQNTLLKIEKHQEEAKNPTNVVLEIESKSDD